MHPNPVFRQSPQSKNLGFARERAFGCLSINGDNGPLAAHVPFILSECGTFAELHLVRSNPISRALTSPSPALLSVTGGDSYVSPDWYGVEHQVPTWNYVAVHLRGWLELLPDDALRDILDRQSAFFENRLLPKAPWLTTKMPPDAMERMMRQIVPARFKIETVDGTWKLGQNKPEHARLGAAEGVRDHGIGSEIAQLAETMARFSNTDD